MIQDDEELTEGEEERVSHKAFDLRKVVTFELDRELYGIDIDRVAEIMEMVPIRHIPNVPNFIVGLINLRGTIVPVIDLRVRFHLESKPWTRDSRIIVMKEGNLVVAVGVDRLWELMRLPKQAFRLPPPDVVKDDSEYFKEIAPVNGRMVIILDMKKILNDTARRWQLQIG